VFTCPKTASFIALLAKLNDDSDLRQRLQGAVDFDAAVEIAKQAGFDVSKADWLQYQEKQSSDLSDIELENVAGGRGRLSMGEYCTDISCPP